MKANKNLKPIPLVRSHRQVKGINAAKVKILTVLKGRPCSMLMIEKETGLRRDSNICRRIRELEKASLIIYLKKDHCEISKRFVKFYTADKTLFPTSKPTTK